MKRVLIVDDDFLVRRYLAQLIDWEKNGYELLEPARDGGQALNIIRDHVPDLVLTDIDMPVMNGIELLMQMREESLHPHIVILSCHDDFAYVRESMRLGAEEYILKDEVSEEKLLEILSDIFRDEAGRESEPVRTQKEADRESEPAITQKGTGRKTEAVRAELLRLLDGVSERSDLIAPDAVAALQVVDYEENAAYQSLENREQFYRSFAELCEEKAEGCRNVRVVHVRGGWFAVLFELKDTVSRQDCQYTLQKNANMFQYEADRHYAVSLRVGITEMHFCGNDVQNCWESAKDLTGHAFYNRGTSFYGWQISSMGNTLPQKAQDFLDAAPEMIARRDREAVREACESVLQTFMKEQTKETIVIAWVRNADRIFQLEMQPAPKHFREMEERVRLYVAACTERLPDTNEYSESIAMVIRYVQKNYADNISLNDAAEAVHLTTTYLSYVFHKDTNITFSEYLQSCRIDRARELLEHTDEKVREIGQMVGYNDNRHFSKTFKKVTGLTPQEYRKQHRR